MIEASTTARARSSRAGGCLHNRGPGPSSPKDLEKPGLGLPTAIWGLKPVPGIIAACVVHLIPLTTRAWSAGPRQPHVRRTHRDTQPDGGEWMAGYQICRKERYDGTNRDERLQL